MRDNKNMTQTKLRIPKLETKNSRDIFSLFVALNAMGYDDENNSVGMSSTRKKVRSVIQQYNFKTQYNTIARTLDKHHPWYLIRTILIAKSCHSSQNFIANIKRFSNEPIVKELWEITKADRTKESQKIGQFFKREVTQLIRFFNKELSHLKRLILEINLLDVYWRGYAIKIKSTGYIIVGPGATKNNNELIRHELLHLLAPSFRLPRRLVACHSSPATASYIGYRVRNRECIVRALNLLYQKRILRTNINPIDC